MTPKPAELHWFKFINTTRGDAEKHMVQTQREFSLGIKMIGLTPRRGNKQTQKLKDMCGKFKGLPATARAHGQNFDGGTAALQSLRAGA